MKNALSGNYDNKLISKLREFLFRTYLNNATQNLWRKS